MAFTVRQIGTSNQTATGWKYRYTDEPYWLGMKTDATSATRVDITIQELSWDKVVTETYTDIGQFFLNNNKEVQIDVMKMLRQIMPSEKYSIAEDRQMSNPALGHIITPKIYQIILDTNASADAAVTVPVIPILGGRHLVDRVGNLENEIGNEIPLDPWAKMGLTMPLINGFLLYTVTLAPADSADVTPIIEDNPNYTGKKVCGAALFWKSSFGGIAHFGFDVKEEVRDHAYFGELDVEGYSVDSSDWNTVFSYTEPNYIGKINKRVVTLKSSGLSKSDIEALQDLAESPAVYIEESVTTGKIVGSGYYQLVRVVNLSAPMSSLADGGNVSVALEYVHKNTQRAR